MVARRDRRLGSAVTNVYRRSAVEPRDLRLPIFLALVAMGWQLAQSVAGLSEGFALLAPALLLALPLLAGRYVGEDVLERVRAARTPRVAPRRERRPRVPRLRRGARPAPRGGLLLAAHLAHRPPPAAV
jgi:hypothetical protein